MSPASRAILKFVRTVGALAWLCIILSSATAGAQSAASQGRQVDVGIRVVPPFVMRQDNGYTGFSIDLWQALARQAGMRFRFAESGPLPELLESVEKREVDLAIAAISITAAREERFDFSQPMFDSGLQVMVRSEASDAGFSFAAIRNLMTSGPIPGLLALLALLILAPAHLVWFSERNSANPLFDRRYFPGILEAVWWAVGAAHGQQQDYPKHWFGKALSALMVFVSVIFIAYFTAAATAALTVQQLKGDINGPEDLPGKRVATVSGSTAAAYLKAQGITTLERPAIASAIGLLQDKQADAVVFDSPVLLYFAANEGKGKVNVVGTVFRKEAYGILFPQDSPLRKPINEALLKLREEGIYNALYRKWFARDEARPN